MIRWRGDEPHYEVAAACAHAVREAGKLSVPKEDRMLQVGKEELARRMYEAWSRSAKKHRVWNAGDRVWEWDKIGDLQRQCWLDAAEVAARVLVDAMAAA